MRHLVTTQISIPFLLSVFYSINLSSSLSSSSSSSSNVTSIGNQSSELLASADLMSHLNESTLINVTSDIPIWDNLNNNNDTFNESIVKLIDNVDNITTPVSVGQLDDLDKTTTTLSSNDSTIDTTTMTTRESTRTTWSEIDISFNQSAKSTATLDSTLSSSMSNLSSINESTVIYQQTTEMVAVPINTDKRFNDGTEGSTSTEEDADILPVPEPGENQASRVACTIDGDLLCSGLTPTCYGSGKIDCGSDSSTVGRKRSTNEEKLTSSSLLSSTRSAVDQCDVTGDIICSPMVSRTSCSGLAFCKIEKMEETLVPYSYWQILLIAGALAVICVTIIVVGIVGYFSWTRYKVRPDAGGQSQDNASKA